MVEDESKLSSGLVATTKASIAINNTVPATGGRDAESVVEVKNNALAYFQAQGASRSIFSTSGSLGH